MAAVQVQVHLLDMVHLMDTVLVDIAAPVVVVVDIEVVKLFPAFLCVLSGVFST